MAMRHWLWYKTSGELGGDLTRWGGWPAEVDFNDPDYPDADVQKARADIVAKPDFAGFLAFECPCTCDPEDPASGMCNCCCVNIRDKYVALPAVELTTKPGMVMLLDGSPVNNDDLQSHPPGTVLPLVFAAAVPDSIPDGYQVLVKHGRDPAQILADEVVVEFTAGVTPAVNVTAPSQGAVGGAVGMPVSRRLAEPCRLRLRGWA